MSDVTPGVDQGLPPETGTPGPRPAHHADLSISADVAWLLATGAPRGRQPSIPGAALFPGNAGAITGSLIAVTFPSPGGGGYILNLPWVGEPPSPGDVVLCAQYGHARVVLGTIGGDADIDYGPAISTLNSEVATLNSEVAAINAAEASEVQFNVVGGQTAQPYGWTGGIETVHADGSGNCSLYWGQADASSGPLFFFINAVVTAWCHGASGGAPIVANVSLRGDRTGLDLHLSGLEGTVVPGNSFSVIYGALGW